MRRSLFTALAIAATAVVLLGPPAYAGSTNGTYVTYEYDRHLPALLDLSLAPAAEPMHAKDGGKSLLVKQEPIASAYVAVASGTALPPGVAASVVLREREPVAYHRLL